MPYGYTKHPPCKWTPEMEVQLIALAESGRSNSSIAREWGMSRDSITNKRAKLAKAGRIEPLKPHWTDEEKTRLVEMKSTGCRADVIARTIGKTIYAVQYMMESMGLGSTDFGGPCVWMKHCREATAKLVALLSEHHPEHETRL